ncbi:MAG TPA: hypothetical protein PKD18_23600, partial [Saprospiraceae bacterium]|nr:hypothetical protein [Saprospiraceae bacterium]
DNQFEIAFSNYCLDSSEEFRYQHAITNLKVLPYIGDYVQVNLNNWIIKLNGYSTRFMRNEKWDKGQPALIYFNFKILLEKLINNEPVFNNIKYSWEGFTDAAYLDLPNQNITKILNTAKSKVANARNFIIIGYSFPYFNREVDSKILSENNFDKVYIQVPDKKEFEAIKERLLSIIGLDYENRIFHRTEADQFFIPF